MGKTYVPRAVTGVPYNPPHYRGGLDIAKCITFA